MGFGPALYLLIVMQLHLCHSVYQATLKNFTSCDNPDPPYEIDRKVSANLTTYLKNNDTFIEGILEVKENLVGYSWRLKAGVVKNNVLKYTLDSKGMNCNNVLVRIVIMATKLKVDKSCKLYKGVYAVENFDIKKIDNAVNFIPMREMGLNSWVLSLYGPKGTSLCYDVRIMLEYLKDKKGSK